MTPATLFVLLAQIAPAAPAAPPPAASEVAPVTVTATAPESVWCVRYPDARSRRRGEALTCRTLIEWDALRRARYDSRGYQEQMALRRFGSALDSTFTEHAYMGRARTALAARQARRAAEAGRTAAGGE